MILRKPTFEDMYKTLFLFSEDEEERKQILSEWINQSNNNPQFFSWVIVKEKDVVAAVTGWYNMESGIGHIGRIEGKELLKQKLFNKILKEFDPEKVTISLEKLDNFADQFKVDSYNLSWIKTIEDIEIENISGEEN